MSFILLLGLGALAVAGIGLIKNLVRRITQAPSWPANFARQGTSELNPLRVLISTWFGPTAVLILFVVISGLHERKLARFYTPSHRSSITPPQVTTSAAEGISALPAPGTQAVPSDDEDDDDDQDTTVTNPPNGKPVPLNWMEVGDTTVGEVRQIVLASKLWSTAEEAAREIEPRAAALVRADFQSRHPSAFSTSSSLLLPDDGILQSAVKKRYVETVEQNFGTFSAPMYRLWLQVEISPVVRTEIYPLWKTAAVDSRIIALGTLIATLTLLANSAAAFSLLLRKTPQRWLRSGVLVSISSTAWIVAELLLINRLHH
ncbi:hypothetical protein [Schlesneria sp. DSM 10557]|uniref:hypothetical protein n=1 Tax=Schlesneria sp. DSM 10557 TaxID=3044399 RepID=UPI00359F3FFB